MSSTPPDMPADLPAIVVAAGAADADRIPGAAGAADAAGIPSPAGAAATSSVDVGSLTRRRVLGLGAGVGAAGLLAACGGGEDTEATPDNSTPTGGPTGDAGGGETGDSGSASGPLVATAEVPVGGGVILEQQKIVVTQPAEGTFKAFTAICTHQACTVSSVKKNVISCACHGSAFSAEDGAVENGPASRPLREIPVTVEGDEVVAT